MIGVAAIVLVAGTGFATAQSNKDHAPGAAASQTGSAKMDQGSKMDRADKSAADKSAQEMKPNSDSGAPKQAASEEDQGKAGARKGKNHNAQAPSKAKNAEARSKAKNAQNAATPKENKEQERTSAEERNRGKATAEEHRRNKTGTTAEEQSRGKNGATAQEQSRGKTGTTAEENKGSERGKSSVSVNEKGAAGASVKLSSEQRSKIQKIVINEHNARRVAHVDFNIRVGSIVPRGKVHVVPVPSSIVEIEPEWRGFMYFLVGDQLVIVEPSTLKIVAVIAA
jgi:hypothetical protein